LFLLIISWHSHILFQEMANPCIRPHINLYPEDAGKTLSEARHAAKWLHELPAEDTTPMIRIGADDYYIHEPAMLQNGQVCIPVRWFTRGDVFYSKAWPMEQVVVEGVNGWCVREDLEMEISQDQLLKNFPHFDKDHSFYNIPHPSRIFGMFNLSIFKFVIHSRIVRDSKGTRE